MCIRDSYSSGIELNAVQRATAEMQKRANNVVRALCEEDVNPVVSIHDHGSAGDVYKRQVDTSPISAHIYCILP